MIDNAVDPSATDAPVANRVLVEGVSIAAPSCLTWELTYACDLSCAYCRSSSGGRDPGELSTAECLALIDEFERTRVCHVHIGGGEPTVRPDFWDIVDYANAHHVGVEFATNGLRITPAVARRLATSHGIGVQIRMDGATEQVNDAVRGAGSYRMAVRAMETLASAGVYDFELAVVVTRRNAGQLDAFAAIADLFGAQLSMTVFRGSGRGADVGDELPPTTDQRRAVNDWLHDHGERVKPCGTSRVVGLVDPFGDIYADPFAAQDVPRAGNVRADGGFARIFTGLTPAVPEYVRGHGNPALPTADRAFALWPI